jgi:ATP-dependent DNA ligase
MTRDASEHKASFTPPMECLSTQRLPEGPDWIYELKLDRFRAQAIRDSSGVKLYSKNGKDFTGRFPQVVAALKEALPAATALDGELVAFDKAGSPVSERCRTPIETRTSCSSSSMSSSCVGNT